MNDYINIAIKEAKKAYKKGEVPVGAVIVKNDKVIAKAYNKKEKTNMATKHAEIIAIEKACKKLKTWHLEDCILYVTLEPCMMCTGAIIQSRINKIIYTTKNEKFGCLEQYNNYKNNNTKLRIVFFQNDESSDLLKSFFKEKRK